MIIGVTKRGPPGAYVDPKELIFLDTLEEFIPVEEFSASPFLNGLFVDESFLLTLADALKCSYVCGFCDHCPMS